MRATYDEDRRLYIEGELYILNYYIENLESHTLYPTPVIKDE
ncbi:hypothetical protein [Paenibacillus sp. P32E]|nr:hypothetical protein [Paenibacillus sp. P32E]